jgi:hypothetical protein
MENPMDEDKPLDNNPIDPPGSRKKAPRKPPKVQGLGVNMYSDKELSKDFSLSIDTKGKLVRDTWSNTALVLAKRAQKAAQSFGKKDFNSLYRLILSAGIAMDKAFPPSDKPLGNNLVVNLFSSLGGASIDSILKPVLPKVEIVEVTTKVEDTSDKPLDDSI